MTPPSVRHSLIIRHATRPLVLLVPEAGGYALPTVMTEERHTAEVDHINAAVHATFGLATIFLRSLSHGESRSTAQPVNRLHELVASGDQVPAAGEWCDPNSMPTHAPRATTSVPKDGRDWERATWWEEARAWIRACLGERGISVTALVQLRAWPSSSVLRVHTGAGDFYFKAVARSIRRECAITAYLAERLPYAVPAIVAVDLDRRWLLLHAARGRKLEDIGTCAHWEQAARMYGRLQVESAGHVESLRACGASERGLEQLTRRLDRLAEEHDQLRGQLPTLHSCAAKLAAYGIPPLLEHGDLWPGNFLVDDTGSILIDWEDAAIGHPFFSIAPLLVGLQMYQPALASAGASERVLAAYLEAFAPFGDSRRLRVALDLAIPLAFCDVALRYSQQPPSVVRLHPWMRDLVPEAVRWAIASVARKMATDEH